MSPVALVTGASRGLGRATAVALAQAGFDVVISARTLEEGEAREHSPTAAASDTRSFPGSSLRQTALAVEATGRDVLVRPADLLDRTSIEVLATDSLEWRGHVDVLVNNARFVGPGQEDDPFTVPFEFVERTMEANFFAPYLLCRTLLPEMVRRGRGAVVNVTSTAAFVEPLDLGVPPGEYSGITSLPYGASKAALLRMRPIPNHAYAASGVRCFDIDPGGVWNERLSIERSDSADFLPPPEVVASSIAWLVTDDEAHAFMNGIVDAQRLCAERELLPGWTSARSFRVDRARHSSPEP